MRKGKKETIKQLKMDYNFLQGLWVLFDRKKDKITEFRKQVGDGEYIITGEISVPDTFTGKLLDHLIYISQSKDWQTKILFHSFRMLARELGLKAGGQTCRRLRRSLDILATIRVIFKNCFIDTGVMELIAEKQKPKTVKQMMFLNFGVVDTWGLTEHKQVYVRLSDEFIEVCRHTLGYKLIPYEPLRHLSGVAYALYRWAYRYYRADKGYGEKWIGKGKEIIMWYQIEMNSVSSYKRPAEIVRIIQKAIEKINQVPNVPIFLELKKTDDGVYKIEIRRNKDYVEPKKKEKPLFDTLPKYIRDAVLRILSENGRIKNPYGRARTMTLDEIKEILHGAYSITLPARFWQAAKNTADRFFEENHYVSLREMQTEEYRRRARAKNEYESTILSVNETKDGQVEIVLSEKIKNPKSVLGYYLDRVNHGFVKEFGRRWRELLIPIEEILDVEEVLETSQKKN